MARWSTLTLYLVGRVNLIKMVTLPRLLYLFQHIMIFITRSFFKNLDSMIWPFLWGNKAPRLKKSILQQPKSKGGLSLPNFQHYFWACNISEILYWNNPYLPRDYPPWVHAEISSTKYDLRSVTIPQLPLIFNKITANPVVSNSLKIWIQLKKSFGLHRASIHMPILNNHAFSPSSSDSAYRLWAYNGLLSVKDLYEEGVLSSFLSLSNKF